jgi:hypothetical protein
MLDPLITPLRYAFTEALSPGIILFNPSHFLIHSSIAACSSFIWMNQLIELHEPMHRYRILKGAVVTNLTVL